MVDITTNLAAVRERIVAAAERSGRNSGQVTIVAVSKTMPLNAVQAAISAGLTDFGENRVQEAAAKFGHLYAEGMQSLRETSIEKQPIKLHLIGSLQRNKVRYAAQLFDYVHSITRSELLSELDKAVAGIPGKGPLPVLLQVNITHEASKAGVGAEELDKIADKLDNCSNLRGVGLMTIARQGAGERELRETFAALRELLGRVKESHTGEWSELSMGMSDDFEYAIEEGATMVRLGRVLFGGRGTVGKLG